jgi:hypothetical protein
MSDRIVGAVDCKGVLDQVVGAEREEVELAREPFGGERGGGHLDHAADRRIRVEGDVFDAQAAARGRDQGQGLIEFGQAGQHRQQNLDLAVMAGAI